MDLRSENDSAVLPGARRKERHSLKWKFKWCVNVEKTSNGQASSTNNTPANCRKRLFPPAGLLTTQYSLYYRKATVMVEKYNHIVVSSQFGKMTAEKCVMIIMKI